MTEIEKTKDYAALSSIRTFKDRAAWLEGRRGYIGGSDAPIILGVTSWSSPLQVWHQKVGAAAIETNVNERQKWGNRLEAAIRDAYEEETGRRAVADPPFSFRVSKQYENVAGSLDGVVVEFDERGPGVLQIKTADSHTKYKWENEAPLEYQVQVQHEMAASGYRWASIAVLLGGNNFFHFDIPRNDEFIEAMMVEERKFWSFVEEGVPPPPSASKEDGKILGSLYGVSPGKTMAFGADALVLHDILISAKEKLKEAQNAADQAKNSLLALMGDAEMAVLPDGSGYRRNERFRDGYTVQPTSFTELRYVKKKGK